MHNTPPTAPQTQADGQTGAALARRRMLLSGLGKGTAVLAAAAPLQSFAEGKIKTLAGTQCTTSGNGSLVMSGAASAPACAAYVPAHFVVKSEITLPALLVNLTAIGDLTLTVTTTLFNAAVGTAMVEGDYLLVKTSATLVQKLKFIAGLTNAAGAAYLPGLKFSDLFAGGGTEYVLKLLSEAPNDDRSFFIAAHFSAGVANASGYSKVPFDRAYVAAQYANNPAAAAAFFRTICIVA